MAKSSETSRLSGRRSRPAARNFYVLVTGGAGFIGSNYVRHLLATDPEARVTNFDNLTSPCNRASVAY